MIMNWHDIPGFEGRLQITREGVVRSLAREVNSPAAGGKRTIKERICKQRLCAGYWAICGGYKGKHYTYYVHRLLALAFIPNPEGKTDINHIDGNKQNNALSNLEWCTHKENMQHAHKTGLVPPSTIGKGMACPAAKLSDSKVASIKKRLNAGEGKATLAKEHGVAWGTIDFIARGVTWSHIEAAR